MSKKELDHHKRLPEPFNDREVPTFNTFKVEALRRGVGYVVDVSKARCSAQVSLLPSDYQNLTPGRLKEFDLVRTRLLDTAEWALAAPGYGPPALILLSRGRGQTITGSFVRRLINRR